MLCVFVKTARFLRIHGHCLELNIFQMSSIFPHVCVVYVHQWCIILECDGSNLMLFVCLDILLASRGHVNPHTGAVFFLDLQNPFCFLFFGKSTRTF